MVVLGNGVVCARALGRLPGLASVAVFLRRKPNSGN